MAEMLATHVAEMLAMGHGLPVRTTTQGTAPYVSVPLPPLVADEEGTLTEKVIALHDAVRRRAGTPLATRRLSPQAAEALEAAPAALDWSLAELFLFHIGCYIEHYIDKPPGQGTSCVATARPNKRMKAADTKFVLPPGWKTGQDPIIHSGATHYYNEVTQWTQWSPPVPAAPPTAPPIVPAPEKVTEESVDSRAQPSQQKSQGLSGSKRDRPSGQVGDPENESFDSAAKTGAAAMWAADYDVWITKRLLDRGVGWNRRRRVLAKRLGHKAFLLRVLVIGAETCSYM